MAEDPLGHTKAVFQALNGFDNVQGEINLVRQGGYKLLVPEPRHGAAWEYKDLMHEEVLPCLRKLTSAAGVEFNPSSVRPAPEEPRRLCALRELWRDAEKLALAPNTFAVLKQVPELQQLVAYTAVPVIAAAGGLQPQFDNVQKLCRLFRLDAVQGLDEVTSLQQLYGWWAARHDSNTYPKSLANSGAGLMLYLTPHMRLALAAEVAAGMLCPGQPPPFDTPEHGIVLDLFVNQAEQQLLQEIKEQRALAASTSSSKSQPFAAAAGGGAAGARTQRPKPARKHKLAKLWAHTQPAADPGQQQQQQPYSSQGSAAAAGGGHSRQLLPPPDKVRSWALSPHIDLQLQVPPQQLLQQTAAIAANRHQQHAQQQGQQQLPDDAQQALVQAQLQELAQQLVQQQVQQQEQQPLSQRSVGALRQELLSEYIQVWLSMGLRAPVQRQDEGRSSHNSDGGTSSSSIGGGSSSSSGVTSTDTSSGGSTDGSSSSSTVDQLVLYSSQLAARCLLELTAAVSTAEGGQQQQQLQQALPLHALQLFSAFRALETAAGQVYMAQEAAATADGSSSSSDTNNASLAAAQQLVVHQALTVCELVRSLRDEAAAAAEVTPPICNTSSAAASRQAGSSSTTTTTTSSTSGSVGGLPPHLFFAGNGPLALQSGQQQPSKQQQARQDQQLQQVLIAAATTSSAATHICDVPGMQQAVLKAFVDLFDPLKDLTFLRMYETQTGELVALTHQLQQQAGVSVSQQVVVYAQHMPSAYAVCVLYLHAALVEHLGLPLYDAAAWQDIACGARLSRSSIGALQDVAKTAALEQRYQQRQQRRHLSSLSDISSGSDSDNPGSDWSDVDDADGGDASEMLRQARADEDAQARVGDARRRHVQGELRKLVEEVCRGNGFRRAGRAQAQQTAVAVEQGANSLRDMASAAAAKLAPLQQWHSQQVQRQQEAASKAHSWSRSPARAAAAVAGATGKAAAGADSDSADTAGAAGHSSGSSVAQDTPHNYHPACPLCKQEQQQAHLNGATSSSSTSTSNSNSPFSCWPVAYDDPFLWRRLLWRLLGKLSPEAQAFYATYLAMCPHCDDSRAWGLVRKSLKQCMWNPPDANLPDLLMNSNVHMASAVAPRRARWLKQYSRALNSAFVESYQASTSLVAKQVLLALSPLHQQVLPPPETAHYLPSSFGPGIGKALMQQLLDSSTPVLDGFAHEHCRLQLWHVWWHVGLRQHQLLQQKQQHMQQLSSLSKPRTVSSGSDSIGGSSTSRQGNTGVAVKASSSSSSSSKDGGRSADSCSSSSHCVNLSVCDELYLDADARLFAVGFATRQLQHDWPANRTEFVATTRSTRRQLLLEHGFIHACAYLLGDGIKLQLSKEDLEKLGEEERGQTEIAIQSAILSVLVAPGLLPMLRGLLEPTAAGPADLLVPLQQQRGTARLPNHQFFARAAGQLAGEVYLQLGAPQPWQEEAGKLRRALASLELSAAEVQAEQEQEVVSEAAALMLADPVPVECLVGPEVWWAWHQSLAKLSACDVCAAEIKDRHRALVCAGCSSAVYCSEACRAGDDGHDLICGKLVDAQQRYSAGSGSGIIPGLPVISSLLQPAPFELPVAGSGVRADTRSFVGYKRMIDEIMRSKMASANPLEGRTTAHTT